MLQERGYFCKDRRRPGYRYVQGGKIIVRRAEEGETPEVLRLLGK